MSNDPDNKNLPQVTPSKNIALASKQLATVNKALTTINREKFIKLLEQNVIAAEFFIDLISECSNVLDMNFIEQHGDQLDWSALSLNESLPWSEAFIERYKDRWNWRYLSNNEGVIKVFNSWTKQEIITALERVWSVHGKHLWSNWK